MTSVLKLNHRLQMSHTCKVGIRTYFLSAFDSHLPMCWIWTSEKTRSAAVVATPILKLWVWYWWRLRLQKDRASRSCSVKNSLETGTPSMKENSGWNGVSCFLILRYCIRDLSGQNFNLFISLKSYGRGRGFCMFEVRNGYLYILPMLSIWFDS